MKAATIANLEDRTSEDERTGAVRSIQAADLSLPEAALQELWSPMYLERLARTYWRFLARVTLGMVRVHYTEHGRSVVLLLPVLKLITFAAPEYELQPAHGIVRWRITSGLLVSRPQLRAVVRAVDRAAPCPSASASPATRSSRRRRRPGSAPPAARRRR
jgi:hypothetical protein